MKIVKLQAENFKKLKAVEIIPVGNIVEITGKCEQGKTTVLDAIKSALCGTKWTEPIRDGQEKGKITIDLGDKIVTRTFTKAGSGALTVESKDKAKYPSPQALLDSIVGSIAFDPLAFSREKDPKKQVDMLLKVVDIKVDPVKVKDISGVVVDVTPNPLDMLNAAYKTVFDNRTVVNRQLDTAKKTLESLPVVPEIEAVSLAELVAVKDELEKTKRQNDMQRQAAETQVQHFEQTDAKVNAINNEISEIEAMLEKKKELLGIAETERIAASKEMLILSEVAGKLVDPDFTDINDRIAKADETNLQAKQYTDRQIKSEEVAKHQAEADDHTAKLKKIIDYKTEIISKTKFPVPGLDFANGGVTFDGKPFSQASTAQKMRVGLGIGMAANPELRVVMIDGYESLDSDQRKIVEEMAVINDFQVWTTAVDSSGKVGIYIEDGEIREVVNE